MPKEQPKIFWDEGEDPNKAPGLPIFRWAPYERKDLVYGNSWIVMGKDRPAGKDSGHSYQETHNYAIDIVVGRSGLNVNKVDPQFKTDSARIYISQKADIDDPIYLDLKDRRAEGGNGNVKAKSAIAVKADAVRIVGREGVKIVTSDVYNSFGAEISSKPGIDLIAGNYKGPPLQPLVKGNNMKKCVERLLDLINMLQNALMETVNYQAQINTNQASINSNLMTHIHPPIPPIVGGPVVPSPILISQVTSLQAGSAGVALAQATKATGLVVEAANLAATKYNYLNPTSRDYICSNYNNTN